MRLIKNNIQFFFPECVFICSDINEDNTNQSIDILGQKFAVEVQEYLVRISNFKTIHR